MWNDYKICKHYNKYDTLDLEKDLMFAEGLQLVNYCEMIARGLSDMGLKVLTPDVGGCGL